MRALFPGGESPGTMRTGGLDESAVSGGVFLNAMRTGGLNESAVPGGESSNAMRTAFEGKRRPRGSVP